MPVDKQDQGPGLLLHLCNVMADLWTAFLDCFPFRTPKDPSDKQFAEGKKAYEKYKTSNKTKHLHNAKQHLKLALENRLPSPNGVERAHLDIDITLATYAAVLYHYNRVESSFSGLDKAIAMDEEACTLFETVSDSSIWPPEYSMLLFSLGEAHFTQYCDSNDIRSFEKAIKKYEKLRRNLDASLELRRKGIMKMGIASMTWRDNEELPTPQQKKERLEKAIELLEEAMEMRGKEETLEDQEESRTICKKCRDNLASAHVLMQNLSDHERDAGGSQYQTMLASPRSNELEEVEERTREVLAVIGEHGHAEMTADMNLVTH